MNRRDLLKGAGVLAFGSHAVRSSALLEPAMQASVKNLVVAFYGPFCYWHEGKTIKVIAPPVGPKYCKAPHQPWAGTTTNEIVIDVARGADLALTINNYEPPQDYQVSGTTPFAYEQGTGTGTTPLFSVTVPTPHVVIGVRPSVAKMICKSGSIEPSCERFATYASGLSFLYPNVDLNGIKLQGGSFNFDPCFTNDESLQDATLGINLTPLSRRTDKQHRRAKAVWGQMLAMFPWVEITGITFCPQFTPSSCIFSPERCSEGMHGGPEVVVGNNCEDPIMTFPATMSKNLKR